MTEANHVLDHVTKHLDQHTELAEDGILLIRLYGRLFITALSLWRPSAYVQLPLLCSLTIGNVN